MAKYGIGEQLPNLKITVGNDKSEVVEEEGEISDKSEVVEEEGEISDSSDKSEVVEEEGEISDSSSNKSETDTHKAVEIKRKFTSPLQKFRKYKSKDGGFATGLDLTSQYNYKKLEQRAARFGIIDGRQNSIAPEDITTLYESLDIDVSAGGLSQSKTRLIRLDTIHMRGVEEMNTSDVFEYFNSYGPSSIEWIDDHSCNVVFLDETGAARALIGLSRALKKRKKLQMENEVNENIQSDNEAQFTEDPKEEECSKDLKQVGLVENLNEMENKTPEFDHVVIMSDTDSDDDDDDDKYVSFKHRPHNNTETAMEVDEDNGDDNESDYDDQIPDIDVPVPPGQWRLGDPCAKAKTILFRFATKDDKKIKGAEKRSHYYKKYGNPNYGGMKGIITTTRKRKINATRNKMSVQHLSSKDDDENSEIDYPIYMTNPGRVKEVRMRMYADDEELRMQRIAEKKKNVATNSVQSRLGERHPSKFRRTEISNDEDSDFEKSESNLNIRSLVSKPDKPSKIASKYKIWNSLAETMAKESEEILPGIKNRDKPWNYFRNKRQSSFHSKSQKSKSNYGTDLRFKLNRMSQFRGRETSDSLKHRSPLLRSPPHVQREDSD